MQRTIFVIDDNETNLIVARNALMEHYRVMTLPSAAKMFALLEKVTPDLILLDIKMPEIDGFEVLRRLKNDASHADIPIIFVTGVSDASVEARGFQLGVVDFITKPFSAPVLLNRIKTHLDIDKLKRELVAAREQLHASEYDNTTLFDSLPVGVRIISLDDGKLVYANRASMEIFGCEDFERDVAGRSAFDFMPEIQPNGKKTIDMVNELLQAEKGAMDFQCFKLNGELFTARITTFNTNYMGKMSSIAITEDITEKKRAEETLKRREKLVDAKNEMDIILLSQKEKTFDDVMGESLRPIADAVNLDRIDVFRLVDASGDQHFEHVYRWAKTEGRLVSIDEKFRILPHFPVIEKWETALSKGCVVNVHTGVMCGEETAFLEPLNVKSLLLTPVLINDKLWGAVAFQDLTSARLFDDDSLDFLSSAARLCANAIIKNEVENELAETEETMSLMLDSTPLCCQLWNSGFKKIDCNKEAIRLFGFKDKQEYLERYHELYPEYQPDGQRSVEKIEMYLKKTIEEGWCSFDWTYKMLDGTLMPAEAIFVRVSHRDDYAVAGYTRDLREHNKMMNDINEREWELVRAHKLYELQLAKLNLVVQATKIGLWEMEVVNNDPVNPSNTFIWSDEFRNMLGFSNETDFPNVLGSWINQLHPEDKAETLDHLEEYLLDITGNAPYDKEYRLRKKNGEYAYFHAYGGAFRDERGNVIRIAGALMDITETKNTLVNNELQLTKLHLMIRATKIGLWDMEIVKDDPINPANAFIWSDELRRLLGFSNEEDFPNILSSWSDRLHPEDRDRTLGAFEKHLTDTTGRTPYVIENRLLRKDGEYGYYRASGETIRDEHGNAIRVAGALMDITESKRMTKALSEAVNELERNQSMLYVVNEVASLLLNSDIESFEKDLFQSMKMIAGAVKIDSICIWKNYTADEKLHCTQLYKWLEDAETNQDAETTINLSYDEELPGWEEILKKGKCVNALVRDMPTEVRHRLSAQGILSKLAVPVFVEEHFWGYVGFYNCREERIFAKEEESILRSGSVLLTNAWLRNEMLVSIRDMSAQSELRTQEFISKFSVPFTQPYDFEELIDNALFELRGFTETDRAVILEFQPDGSLLCTYESVINEETPKMLGRSLSYEDRKPILDEAEKTGCFYEKEAARYFAGHPLADLGEKSFCYIPLMIEGERAGYLVFFTMFEQANWDEGEFRLVTMTGSIIAGAFSIRKNDELKEAAFKAQQESEAKSNFLSFMSHEIRTPLNAILGITEIQLQSDALERATREALNMIYNSGDLLLGIINDILDLSRIEAGKLELIIADYEIASLINDSTQLNMMRIGSKPIEFELFVDETTPSHLSGDELRIKQILNNLLSNAFKYTHEGKVELWISSEANDNDDSTIIILRVSDTGLGMTAEQVKILFDRFTRFAENTDRRTEGTGLGMNITQELVRLMNGEISIESEPGKGSVVTVRLPQGKIGSGVVGAELAKSLRQFSANRDISMKRVQITREYMPYGSVLIVDDVKTNIYVARGLMIPYGLKIDTAESGYEAIEKISNGNVYDIIFMDHMMPEINGIETTKIIKDMGYEHPIVVLTANAVAGQADIFLRSGFSDFISKPIDVRQLNAVLNKFIRYKQPPEVIEAARRQPIDNKDRILSKESDASIDPQIIEAFIRDASKSIATLDSINTKQGQLSEEDKRMYETHVHGMKSALANVGKQELSSVAFKLETSARNGDIELMTSETSAFIDSLRAAVNDLTKKEEAENSEAAIENESYLCEKLLAIKAACNDYDVKTVSDAIIQLREKSLPQSTRNLIAAIDEYLLHSDFDEIIDVVDKHFESEQT